jgi:hypothetical protein
VLTSVRSLLTRYTSISSWTASPDSAADSPSDVSAFSTAGEPAAGAALCVRLEDATRVSSFSWTLSARSLSKMVTNAGRSDGSVHQHSC